MFLLLQILHLVLFKLMHLQVELRISVDIRVFFWWDMRNVNVNVNVDFCFRLSCELVGRLTILGFPVNLSGD